ncbi:MAG: response regulator transcription factor [Nostoc sp. NOS(2021)]|uniref:response regulator transcription factor n=1 Tax=Nostoc sp. NOS(2021) TaxID=2815407 RepID=UPI0026014883|nr:response regulator transcription factor [Nostoc sp. NOS(2021)]MBN3896636.1 response regulator transcription factor [Nostoc sp. NOS(2021)]
MRILIVEDDDRIAKPLAEFLRRQHHIVDITTDGLEAWEWSQSGLYELILLDLMLPKLDGITLCKRLRDASSNVLILMLTARDTTGDKIIGLDAGADDYLVKPFDLKELAAHIRALARRTPEIRPQILIHGDLQLDPATQQVTYRGNIILLTPKEYLILEYFLRNPNQVVTRSVIIDKLWNFDKSSGEGSIKTHITNLRNKLRASGSSEELIENIYGIGYRLGHK